MDGTLRIWDVILARQIDAVHVEVSVTALSLSPTMDVLATTHVDQNGVYLWVNRSVFSGASRIDTYASGNEVVNVKLPSLTSVEGSNAENEDTDKSIVKHSVSKEASTFPAFSQQIPDLVTLSSLPKSQWQSLINLDIIKRYATNQLSLQRSPRGLLSPCLQFHLYLEKYYLSRVSQWMRMIVNLMKGE